MTDHHLVPSDSDNPSHGGALLPPNAAAVRMSPEDDGGDVDLGAILAVLRRYWKLVAIITIAVAGGGAYFVHQLPARYEARAVMAIAASPTVATEILGPKSGPKYQTELQLLRTWAIASEVVERTALRFRSSDPAFTVTSLEDPQIPQTTSPTTMSFVFSNGGFEVSTPARRMTAQYGERVTIDGISFTLAKRPSVTSTQVEVKSHTSGVSRYTSGLGTSQREGTNLIDVKFVANDRRLAQQVANTVVERFAARSQLSAKANSSRRRVVVEQQLLQMDSLLSLAQANLNEFRKREQVFSLKQKYTVQQTGIMDLQERLNSMKASSNMYRQLLAAARNAKTDPSRLRVLASSPGISDNAVVMQLYNQLFQYETQIASLTTGPRAKSATNEEVERLRLLVDSTRSRMIEAAESHIIAAEANIQAVTGLTEAYLADMQKFPDTEAEEGRLLQQVASIQSLVNDLRADYQRARIAEAVEVGGVEIVERARVPSRPIGSSRSMQLALFVLGGLVAGCGAALLRDRMDTAIRHKDQLEGVMHVPALAVIPQIVLNRTTKRDRALQYFQKNQKGSVNGDGRAGGASTRLVTLNHARSAGAESYRTLRTNLIFSRAIKTLRRLVVTSASAGEGKTTTVANLAITFAQQGMRVLVVDGDLRRPQLHKVFDLRQEPGLTDAVVGQESTHAVIQSTAVENLDVVASGMLPPNPLELLGSAQFRQVLDALSGMYDIVILDTPPLLAASDAAVLASLADGTIVVVRAGSTERLPARAALQQLHSVGARVLGAVLNDPDAKSTGYGSIYDYYSHSGYYGAPEAE